MAKRASLSSFSPQQTAAPAKTAKVVKLAEAAEPTPGVKYPKVTVYLTADEVRTLKLLNIDTGQKVSDICALAIRDWLARNGHARG